MPTPVGHRAFAVDKHTRVRELLAAGTRKRDIIARLSVSSSLVDAIALRLTQTERTASRRDRVNEDQIAAAARY